MAWSTAARRSGLTLGEPRSTSETRDLETPARSATSRMVGRGAGCSPLTCIRGLRGVGWNDLPNELSSRPRPGRGADTLESGIRRRSLDIGRRRRNAVLVGTIHNIPILSNLLFGSRRSGDERQYVTGDGVRPVQPGVPGRPVPGVPLDARRGPGVLQREVELVGAVPVLRRP